MTSVGKERDALLAGAGIMSATLAVFSKELDPIPQYVIAYVVFNKWSSIKGADTHFIHDPP